jgi:NAD(P)-dependent dehydrogenase (short-subunit alcohol dehydrogenase family)
MEGKVSHEAPDTVLRDGLFRDQLALITGGGTGIGLATARLMGRLGAKVILAARDEERLVMAAKALQSEGIEAHAIPLNIRDEAQVESVFDRVAEEHGLPDALVNNAGGQFVAASVDISANGFRAVVDLNLNGTWHMSRAYGSRLIAAGRAGHIVNIVLCQESGMPGMAHAGAARAGVVNLTKTLAYEWGPHGITVNAIAPGTIETEGLVQYGMEAMEKYVSVLPIARMGAPQEVADLVAYLCSPAASYITGALVPLDGGEHLNGASIQEPA